MKPEKDRRVIKAGVEIILSENGFEMNAQDFCDELIRRGWAFPDLCPADLGCEVSDTIKYDPTCH